MRSDARQRQILDCAKRVFARRGFHSASISHICAEAGIGRGTLYLYFQNKKSVFTAIVREVLGRVQTLMAENQREPLPAPETLRRGQVIRWSAAQLRRVLETVFQDVPTLRILLREAVGVDAVVEQLLGEIDEALIAIVSADLRAGQEAGFVRAELDPRLTATLMVGGVEKLALTALRSAEPPDHLIDLDHLALETSRLHLVGVLSDRVVG